MDRHAEPCSCHVKMGTLRINKWQAKLLNDPSQITGARPQYETNACNSIYKVHSYDSCQAAEGYAFAFHSAFF